MHLFDSFSTDRTLEFARTAGCVITQRKFDNWSAHQNWGLANIPFKYPWVLYNDADERVSPELKALIRQQANAQNRSMTSYPEWLVLKDVALSPRLQR